MDLPRYTLIQLEEKALSVIRHYKPASETDQQAVPIELFIEALQASGHLSYSIAELGYVEGYKILGLFTSSPQCAIYIDHSIVDSIRFRFTLAHELGHFVLHRRISISGAIADTSESLNETASVAKGQRQWAEWQANNFAASILMPQRSLGTLVFQHAEQFGLGLGEGQLIIPNTATGRAGCERFIDFAASRFEVSKTSLRLRMTKLGIL